MQLIISQSKVSLVEYSNDTNFPAYYENKSLPLLSTKTIIDIIPTSSYSQGQHILRDEPIVIANALFLTLQADEYFYYSLDDTNYYIRTKNFTHNDLEKSLNVTLYSNTYLGYNTNISTPTVNNVVVKYFSIVASAQVGI
jgi:hypothetical protein